MKKEEKKKGLSFEGEGTSSWGDPITGTWSILTDYLGSTEFAICDKFVTFVPFWESLRWDSLSETFLQINPPFLYFWNPDAEERRPF